MKENKSKGLGDSIAKITHALKIDKVADAVSRLAGLEGCGCEERKQFLNELFPYNTTKRKFVVLENFSYNNINYKVGQKIRVGKENPLHREVIRYVEENKIKEL